MNTTPAHLRRRPLSRRAKTLFALGLAAATIGGVAAAQAQRRGGAGGGGDRLEALRAQYRALQAQVEPCMAQISAALDQQALGAIEGQMIDTQPACAAMMPEWTAQAAVLEKEIYQAQTGAGVSATDFVLAPEAAPGAAPETAPAAHDDGLAAVERYDLQAVRGHGIYTGDDGTAYELPLAPSYYQDRSSGDIVPTELAQPPDGVHDWQPLQQEN
jgi:hypothetical protein